MSELNAACSVSRSRSLLLVALMALGASACQSAQSSAVPAKTPVPKAVQARLNNLGAAVADAGTSTQATVTGTASFNAPLVDLDTWNGSPVGTGQFSIALQPVVSGTPESISFEPLSRTGTKWYAVGISSFTLGTSGPALWIIRDSPFTLGTSTIDNVHQFVDVADDLDGQLIASATGGTVSITAAGIQTAGTLTAQFQSQTDCISSAGCPVGTTCQAGVCGPTSSGCTSDAQCATGEVCTAGSCVVSSPACVGAGTLGTGTLTVNLSIQSCSPLSPVFSANPLPVTARLTDNDGGAVIRLENATLTTNPRLLLVLALCPAPGQTVAVGSGLSATVLVDSSAGPNVRFSANYGAVSETVSFTQSGSGLGATGTFDFGAGGTASTTFSL